VVHFIMLRPLNAAVSDANATFLHYLSFLGVHQHIRPTHIVIHGDVLPQGAWWRRTANDVANIYFVNVTDLVPSDVYGKPLRIIEHRTDLLRFRLLYGIPSHLYTVFLVQVNILFSNNSAKSQMIFDNFCQPM